MSRNARAGAEMFEPSVVGEVDYQNARYASSARVYVCGVLCRGVRRWGYRSRVGSCGRASYAAPHRRKLGRATTGRHLHQWRRWEHHHQHPLGRVEEVVRLRRRHEQHSQLCSRLRGWIRDTSAHHRHPFPRRVRALDKALGDPSPPQVRSPLWPSVVAAWRPIASDESLALGRQERGHTRKASRALTPVRRLTISCVSMSRTG